jgi:predicted TPR repeat methyltransferase
MPYIGDLDNIFFNIKNILKNKFLFIFNIELALIKNNKFYITTNWQICAQ